LAPDFRDKDLRWKQKKPANPQKTGLARTAARDVTTECVVHSAPFLKWAGGKRQLVERILAVVPSTVDTYYEPFVGGGAVFFALAAEKERRFRHAVLADANAELVTCYRAIKADVDAVIDLLATYRYDRDFFYELRARRPDRLAPAARAARLIYLNRCGYNGLYRVNSRGLFNVPFGRYKDPRICDPPRLRAVAAALRDADIERRDFEKTVAPATTRDFVYLDPPYVPVSRTSSFTGYAERGFGPDEQSRLASALRRLGEAGVPALLSNSDCRTTRALYRGLPVTKVLVGRAINSVAERRGAVAELLVKSFRFQARAHKAKAESVARSRPSPPGKPGLPPQRRLPRPSSVSPDPHEN
jgi:DNA adenine methylase